MPPRGPSDSFRPRYRGRNDSPPRRSDSDRGMYEFRGERGRRDRNPQRRDEFSFRSKKPWQRGASERQLLTHTHTSAEQSMLGENYGGNRFRDINEITDSEEEPMDDSDSNAEDEGMSRGTKRLKPNEPDAAPVVKWSNPDVYSALPPPAETNGKHIDVVKLIRKARDESKALSQGPSQNQDDFISFDVGDDFSNDDTFEPPQHAPSGPKAMNRGPPPTTLGKRKREVESELISRGEGRAFHVDGMVLAAWRMKDGVPSTPWLRPCTKGELPSIALHREIVDFWNWVKPQDYEDEVRQEVIERLDRDFNRIEEGDVKAFGSYAAGMYLPIADMDLVFNPRRYRNRPNTPIPKHLLFLMRNYLERQGIARPGSVKVIAGARVPLVKFVDHISGLKVDVSFNNDTGTKAIPVFEKWKKEHPAMPVIVAVIKQFLMIRGFNDVSIGGLGGFSTICLVTSLLQHMPGPRNANLGEVLIEFFNLYGNLFNRQSVAIRLDPPGYIDKLRYKYISVAQENSSRLMIIDPNRPENNISGGSGEIGRIFDSFSKAHRILQDRMDEFYNAEGSLDDFSFLRDIIGGDFSSYDAQRQILRRLRAGSESPQPAIVPPPPPPIRKNPLPARPAPPAETQSKASPPQASHGSLFARVTTTDSDSRDSNKATKERKAEKRLQRVKSLCPELSTKIGNKKRLSANEAIKLGGWKDGNTMAHDLDTREAAMKRKKKKEETKD